MKKIAFIVFMAIPGWGACPLFQYKDDPHLNQEIQNICANISNPVINGGTANTLAMNGGFQLKALTLSQIQSLQTPLLGQEYFCSNCTTDAVCVSTSTSKGSFSRTSNRSTVCS